MTSSARRRSGGALLLAVAALTACGGSDSETQLSPPAEQVDPAAAASPQPSPSPVPSASPSPSPSAQAAPPLVQMLNRLGVPPAGNELVLIKGTGFQAGASVSFGGVSSPSVFFDAVSNVLQVTAPPYPAANPEAFVDVVITNPDGQAATFPGFHYGPPPVALSFATADGTQTLNNGKAGQLITIAGADFSSARGVQVSIGGVASPSSANPAELVVGIPKLNPGSYQVIVTNFDGQFDVAPGILTILGP
jgi:large repetitive protein